MPQSSETLRRGRVEGCEYTIADKNGVDYFVGVATPEQGGDARTQIFSAFSRLEAALSALDFDCVVELTVFLRRIGDKQLVRAIMHSVWGDSRTIPATTIIAQTPCEEGCDVILCALAVNSSSDSPNSMPISVYECDDRAAILEYGDVSFGFFGGFVPAEEPVGAYERSFSAFSIMRDKIESLGFLFPNVIRTWLYQGNIVLPEADTQRYKELNRARTDFFHGTRFFQERLPKDVKFGAVYPASTGIGADDVDVVMSALAIKTERDDLIVAPLENPNQTSAFDYSDYYSPKSPKFARAVALALNGRASIFVSGTASIVNQETVYIGDPAGQTNQTLDNIAALISGDNLERHGVKGFESTLDDLAVARVYVKKPEHYQIIREICDKRLPNTPKIYTFADVCRDDLLVEVEGVVACKIK